MSMYVCMYVCVPYVGMQVGMYGQLYLFIVCFCSFVVLLLLFHYSASSV